MIVVHYLENSRAHRILWLLEELGLDYEVKLYRRDKNFRAPPELKKAHPLGKSPVIEDGDLRLAESGAIVEYLIAKAGASELLRTYGDPTYPAYLYFLHGAEGSDMPVMVNRLVFSSIKPRSPALLRPIAGKIADQLDQMMVAPMLPPMFDEWNDALSGTGWFAGEFSAADIMMSYPVKAASARANAAEGRPAVQAFVERIEARPAYQRALERGAFTQLAPKT